MESDDAGGGVWPEGRADSAVSLFGDYTFRQVVLGCLVLGLTSGALGCFALLRRQGLLGDALAHAALPGICLAFMVTGTRQPMPLMLGAAATGGAAAAVVQGLVRRLRVDSGSALAAVLTTFFGLGIVLLSVIQKSGSSAQAGLDKMIFGQAASLVGDQVAAMTLVGGVVLACALLIFKELKLLCFDPDFAQVQGLPVGRLTAILTILLVASIVIGLSTVGVVLMSAMLVAPGAAARQWSRSLSGMLMGAGAIGAVCGAFGAGLSVLEKNTPTGPVIVLTLALVVGVSVFFGKERGLVWASLASRRAREGVG